LNHIKSFALHAQHNNATCVLRALIALKLPTLGRQDFIARGHAARHTTIETHPQG